MSQELPSPGIAARRYGRMGFAVLPLEYPITSASGTPACSCAAREACEATGRHPILDEQHPYASSRVPQIDYWWNKYPNANVGLAAGDVHIRDPQDGNVTIRPPVRFHALEVGAGAVLEMDELLGKGWDRSVPVIAGSNGSLYALFAAPPAPLRPPMHTPVFGARAASPEPLFRRPIPLGPGARWLDDGCFVVAPPSVDASGGRGRWGTPLEPDGPDLARPPAALAELIVRKCRSLELSGP